MMNASSQRKTALFVKKTSEDLTLYLYRPNFFYNGIEAYDAARLEYTNEFDSDWYLVNSLHPEAMTYDPDNPHVGSIAGLIASRIGDVWEVRFSRANHGTGAGPMLYEIAMQEVGWLTPDRESVTGEAENVWKKFYSRNDVVHRKLSKGVKSYPDDRPWMDCQYKLKKGSGQDVTVLRSVHKMAVEAYSKWTRKSKNPMSVSDIENTLERVLLTRFNLG